MQKKKMLSTLSDYYIKKGKVFESSVEYSRQSDIPYSIKDIKKVMGGWSMLFKYLNSEYPNINKDCSSKGETKVAPVKTKTEAPKPAKPSMSSIKLTTGRNETNE